MADDDDDDDGGGSSDDDDDDEDDNDDDGDLIESLIECLSSLDADCELDKSSTSMLFDSPSSPSLPNDSTGISLILCVWKKEEEEEEEKRNKPED